MISAALLVTGHQILTSLSAPSMQTYLARLKGLARSMMSFITTPVNSAVETPDGPHEKPLLFRTTFCSFRLLPAQTRVMGYVTFSYSSNNCRSVTLNGFATSLWVCISHEVLAGRYGYVIPFY
jgi:hypothetical protein